jgi:hypothetical protein
VADIVKFTNSLRLRCSEHNERMNNERMPKQVVNARMEGIRKREKQWKRWTDEVEEDLKIMGVRNVHTVARDRKEWRRNLLVHNALGRIKRRRRMRRRIFVSCKTGKAKPQMRETKVN